MNFRSTVRPLAVIVVALAAMPVRADLSSHAGPINPDIARAANQLSVGLGVLHQDYKEFNDGPYYLAGVPDVVDSENGNLPNLRIQYTALVNRIYGQVLVNIASGDTTYEGRYLSSPTVPVTATTSNTFVNITGRIGYGFRAGASVVLIPYIELGDNYWRRDVGYYEDYSHFLIGAGGKVLWSPTRRLVLEGGLGVGEIVLGSMTNDIGTFDLGSKPYISVYGSIDYRFTDRWHLSGGIDFRQWEYGTSNTLTDGVYVYWEPHSETLQTTLFVSGGYSF